MKDENAPLIKYSKLFNKQRKALPLDIKIAFREARELFLEDPNHPSLRDHSLKEKFAGYRSIDVTDDWRAIFKETQSGKRKVVTFHLIGTHKDLYGS